MQGERVEIRTPNENILVCALCESNGHGYAEVKRKNKSDLLEIDSMIHMLMDYKNQIER